MYTENELRVYPRLAEILDKATELREIRSDFDRYRAWQQLTSTAAGAVRTALDAANMREWAHEREMTKDLKKLTAMNADLILSIPLKELEAYQ